MFERLVSALFLLTMTITLCAQKEVTKFLGIPIDGTKPAMIQKLRAKGFTYNAAKDELNGEFNGHNVTITVQTNNNKVWRLAVLDASPSSETNIKIRFNNLCRQFEKNQRYARLSGSDFTISDEEDISYEMSVNNKRYEASYCQKGEEKDSIQLKEEMLSFITQKYTQEQLSTMTEEQKGMLAVDWFKSKIEEIGNRLVWFMISQESYNEYTILMFYENRNNKSDGEDL